MLAALAPEQRDRLTSLFGRSGAESIVLASMPGRVLWTDDAMLASYARTEFGVRRIWTQSALMTRVRAGSLDPAELATAGTKLAGWGYSFTTPSLETLMRAGSVAMWNPAHFPLGQALDMFATDSLKLGDAVTLAAEFIVNNSEALENKVYSVPADIDENIAALKLETMGIKIDKLTAEQEKYLASWQEGT